MTLSENFSLLFPQRCPQRSPEQWPAVLHLIEQGESLRHVAIRYHVSYETVRRVIAALRKQQREGG